MNRYSQIPIKKTKTNTLRNKGMSYLCRIKYPEIGKDANDIYVITEWGDRFDLLAHQFYGDISLWWIITNVNAFQKQKGSMFCPVGAQLVIPQNLTKIMSDFNSINTPLSNTIQSSTNSSGGY